MNWSRAKTILIAALIITNVILLINYLSDERELAKHIAESTDSAIKYMQDAGIDIKCDVPQKSMRLPVITVNFKEGDQGGSVYDIDVNGMVLEIVGLETVDNIESIIETEKKIDTLPAYTALLNSLGSVENEISNIELIYLVDRTAYIGEGGEDTALPYWKISSGDNSFYYSAFSE